MEILDIIIILLISFFAFKIYEMTSTNSTNENIEQTENMEKIDDMKKSVIFNPPNDDNREDEPKENIYDSSMKYIDMIKKSKEENNENNEINEINPYFMESQFHNDYRDTLDAFVLLIPNQRQLFNRSDLPIINVSTPTKNEIFPLAKNFVKEVNKVLDKNVVDNYAVRNWKSDMAEKPFKSGWEKQQEKLGLPGSIYNAPANKEPIKLIRIDHSERFETEDEIRYVAFLIIQKPSAKDQLLIKVSFQIDKQDINLDREFFEKGKKGVETLIKIEEVFVMGFLTKHSFGKHSVKSEYYDFNGITDGRIFSQKQILEELNKKRKQYESECVYH
jgi:hypothetical protein